MTKSDALGAVKKKVRGPGGLGKGVSTLPKCDYVRPDGRQCTNDKGKRTNHPGIGRCWKHGGTSPTHVRAAQKVMVAQAIDTYGLPREIAPHDALREEVWRTAGHVQWLERKIHELDPEALVWGTTKRKLSGARVEPNGGAADAEPDPDAAVEIVREVRLAEHHSEMIAAVIRGVLAARGLSMDDPVLRSEIRQQLMLVAAEG